MITDKKSTSVLRTRRLPYGKPRLCVGASIPPAKAPFPTFPSLPFPIPLPSPLPPPLVLPSLPSIPFLLQSGPPAPVKPARVLGEHCKLSQWDLGSRHRFWCILRGKNTFDSNYCMDFCILKFVKLLIGLNPPANCPWRIYRQR